MLSLRSIAAAVPLLLGVVALAGCYEQPEISKEKPLTCSAEVPAECPKGFVCVGNRVCAPQSCSPRMNSCPVGLVCASSRCQFPGDGGAGGDGDGGVAADATSDGGGN